MQICFQRREHLVSFGIFASELSIFLKYTAKNNPSVGLIDPSKLVLWTKVCELSIAPERAFEQKKGQSFCFDL